MVIDTGAGVSQNVLSFVMAADEIIVVTTPEPTAITDAYGIIKSIAAQSPGQDHQDHREPGPVRGGGEPGGAAGDQHRRAVPEYQG